VNHPLTYSILTLIVGLAMHCQPVEADAYTEQEILIARVAVNESTWSESDVAAVAYARALYSPSELRASHRRALAVGRTDSRRWIESLDASLSMPAGWPEHLVPWETRGRAGWSRTLEIVHDVVSGRVVPCDARPSTWGGNRVDAARIARMTANGWRVVRCEGRTSNVFLRQGGER
jgi:hypothetical protein